jgi:hypothetical protein
MGVRQTFDLHWQPLTQGPATGRSSTHWPAAHQYPGWLFADPVRSLHLPSPQTPLQPV